MISLRVSKRSTLQQRINLSNHNSGPKSNSNHIAISISFFLFGLSRDHKQLLLRSAVVARSELPFTFSQTLIIIAGETKLLLFFCHSPCRSTMQPFRCTRMATTEPTWIWSHRWPSRPRKSRESTSGECGAKLTILGGMSPPAHTNIWLKATANELGQKRIVSPHEGHTWCTSPTRKHLSGDFTFATLDGAVAAAFYLELIFAIFGNDGMLLKILSEGKNNVLLYIFNIEENPNNIKCNHVEFRAPCDL